MKLSPWGQNTLPYSLSGWLESDRAVLTASLGRFVGVPDYGPDSLREDFARFRFLLGFTDGEGLFTADDA
jgi:hypothetical protein